MKIGIDARPLQGETQYRGIGKSLENVLRVLLADPGEHSFVFYIDGGLTIPSLLENFPGRKLIAIPSTRLGRKRYFRSVLASYRPARVRRQDVDVFLQYDASLGVPTSVPCVTVFYDLIPLLFRDKEKKQSAAGLRKYKNSLAGNLYWKKYIRTFSQYKRAQKIIAISHVSKQDYLKHTGSHQDVAVVHLGASGFGEAAAPTDPVQKLTSRPYLLYVGGIDFRKNVVALVQTFYELKLDFPDLRLLAVGKEFGLESQLGDLGWQAVIASNKAYAKDILTPGFISDSDLAWLYGHAMAFVFPSRYEGFGLPVLEAMQAGCPVVAYDNSSIPEVAGDAALLVPDGDSLVPAITKVLKDEALRQTLIQKGKARAKRFSWDRTARETLAILEEAGGKKV